MQNYHQTNTTRILLCKKILHIKYKWVFALVWLYEEVCDNFICLWMCFYKSKDRIVWAGSWARTIRFSLLIKYLATQHNNHTNENVEANTCKALHLFKCWLLWTLTLTKTALYWTAYSSCFLDGYPSQDQGVKSLTCDWSIVTNPAFSLVENRTFINFGYCTFLPLYHHHNPFVTVPIFTLICLSSSSATLSVNYQWRKFPKSSLSVYCKLNVLN